MFRRICVAAIILICAYIAMPSISLAVSAYDVCIINGTRESVLIVMINPGGGRTTFPLPHEGYREVELTFEGAEDTYYINAQGLETDRYYGRAERKKDSSSGSMIFRTSGNPEGIWATQCEDAIKEPGLFDQAEY